MYFGLFVPFYCTAMEASEPPREVATPSSTASSAASFLVLDCLALIAQHCSTVREMSVIHCVSHHWRQILIQQDRFSHAYASIGYSHRIAWCEIEEGQHWSSQERLDHEKTQLHDLTMLAGLQLSLRHLRALNIEFHMTNNPFGDRQNAKWTNKFMTRIKKLRLEFYALLQSLTSIQHLVIVDTSITIDDPASASGVISYTSLAGALTQCRTLRSFYFDNGIDEKMDPRMTPTLMSHQTPPVPDALVTALCKNTQLRSIGGGGFGHSLLHAQWIRLFSSLEHIECLASLDQTAIGNLTQICRYQHPQQLEPLFDSQTTALVIDRIRRLRCITHSHDTGADTPDSVFQVTMNCVLLRLLPNVSCWTSMVPRTLGEKLKQVRELSLNVNNIKDFTQFMCIPRECPFVHQLELTDLKVTTRNSPDDAKEMQLLAFLNAFPSLKCLILTSGNLPNWSLNEILTSCTKLLELRVEHTVVKYLTPQDLHSYIKSHPSLHLLQLGGVRHSTKFGGGLFEMQRINNDFNREEFIKVSAKKGAKMLEYAGVLDWLDLLTLEKQEIRRRLKEADLTAAKEAAVAAVVAEAATRKARGATVALPSSSSFPLPLRHQSWREAFSCYLWFDQWERTQQLAKLEAGKTK